MALSQPIAVTRQDVSRYTDVGEESVTTIQLVSASITQTHPNVSLTNALKPLYHLIENLRHIAEETLKKCANPKDGLLCDESAAIYLYTEQWPVGKMSFYSMFNRVLREQNPTKFTPFQQYYNLFMAGMKKLPPAQDRLWRGENGDWGKQYAIGVCNV